MTKLLHVSKLLVKETFSNDFYLTPLINIVGMRPSCQHKLIPVAPRGSEFDMPALDIAC